MASAPKPNGWTRPILAMLIPLIGAAVAFGILQSDVGHNDREITRVEVQAERARLQLEQRMQASLVRIEAKLDRLIERGDVP